MGEQVQAHVEPAQVVGQVHRRLGTQQVHVGQGGQSAQLGAALDFTHQHEGAPGQLRCGPQQGGQVQIPPDGACPAQNGPGDGGQVAGKLHLLPGEHGEVDAVGEEGDVVVAGGQVVDKTLGGGEDDVGGQGQVALPLQGKAGPVPVAVVHQPPEGQAVQQMDLVGTGGPENGLPEPVAVHLGGDKAGSFVHAP